VSWPADRAIDPPSFGHPGSGAPFAQKGVTHVIVTCGAEGVCWCSDYGHRWFAAPRVRAMDTVGAGDCFSGALAACLARGEPMADAIQFAVTAAAICVTRNGAQPSLPTRKEIIARWRDAQSEANSTRPKREGKSECGHIWV
jgi:sugar/nucleoside kinase (ribokinase family)